MKQYNFNKVRNFSREVGGARDVYGGKETITAITGYRMPLEAMAPVGQVLPAGTPFSADDLNKVARPHFAFALNAAAGATDTTIQVVKEEEGTRAKAGMRVILLPATIADITAVGGTAVEITAVDTSNANYDVLTLATGGLGAAGTVGDIIVEATDAGEIKVIPTTTSFADIPTYGDEEIQLVDLVTHCNAIYVRRVPPIHPAIREYMNAHGYFVRFYGGY